MDLGLKGRVAIVTGGSGGNIGSAICRTFAQEGANVVVVARREEVAQKVAQECQALGVKAMALKVDITKPEDTEAMAKKVLDTFGQIDILVNNAFVGQVGRFLRIEREVWRPTMEVCFYGTMNCTRAVLPHMVERKSGRVISIGSDAGRSGDPSQPIYSGAKGAIIAWNKSLALDQGPNGITFNVVCPSLTGADTPEGRERREKMLRGPERVKEVLERFYPLRKFSTPEDIAAMVVFLASEKGSDITGQTISVNGGYYMG